VHADCLPHQVRPGGFVFWSAPFLERFHFSYEAGDYFRYTCMGAQELLTQAGFEIADVKKVGDSHMASAYLLGLGVGDIHQAHLRHALISNFSAKQDDHSDKQWLSISCVLVARRPVDGMGNRSDVQDDSIMRAATANVQQLPREWKPLVNLSSANRRVGTVLR
jgi:hypothetical protein